MPSIPEAVRNLRKSLGLLQVDFAARVQVARETVSSWEQGRLTPAHEQRVAMAKLIGGVPAELAAPILEAFGIAPPKSFPGAPRVGSAEQASRVLAAVRAAADQLDVPASALRRTLAVFMDHARAAGVSLQDASAVVGGATGVAAEVKTRTTSPRRPRTSRTR